MRHTNNDDEQAPTEAVSMGALNALAFEPLQYPEEPEEKKRNDLVLYICRVPGTRDIILSPAKPQPKNVTAEDIAASLYYIHWKGANLDIPPPKPPRLDDQGHSSDDASSMTIPRKPLPEDAHPAPIVAAVPPPPPPHTSSLVGAIGTTPLAPTTSLPHEEELLPPPSIAALQDLQENSPVPRRARAATTNSHDNSQLQEHRLSRTDTLGMLDLSLHNHRQLLADTTVPPRKPVGPRAMVSAPKTSFERKPVPGAQEILAQYERRGSAQSSRNRFSTATSRSPSPRKRGLFSSPDAEPFTLEIIRRNPSTGEQWTVGQIASHQLESPGALQDNQLDFLKSQQPEENHTSSPPIDIQLANAGYAKFRHIPAKVSCETFVTQEIDYISLRRQVLMSYSKSRILVAKEEVKDTFHRFVDEHITKKGHARQPSDDSTEGAEKSMLSPVHPGHGMKRRGYVFSSPWGTNCVFHTALNGNAIKCVRNLDDGNGVYNPLTADDALLRRRPTSAEVSELRFDLPMPGMPSTGGKHDVESWVQGHLGKIWPGGSKEGNGDDGQVSPFDLNLGGEKAGGGRSGTRAKMGKLIVHDDGQKMLDLVVAANMGVWWGAYERSF